MRAFNLLQYPALASQRRKRHRLWTSLTGLAVGSFMAGWAAQWVQEAADQALQERHRLQAQLTQQQVLWRSVQKDQALHQKWHLQSAHLTHIDRQRASWQALHQALQNELGPDSVQLIRLQLEANQLELHGRASSAQRMDEVRQNLSVDLAPHLRSAMVLSSLVALPVSGPQKTAQALQHAQAGQAGLSGQALEFVWQSGWPDGTAPAQLGSAKEPMQPTQPTHRPTP